MRVPAALVIGRLWVFMAIGAFLPLLSPAAACAEFILAGAAASSSDGLSAGLGWASETESPAPTPDKPAEKDFDLEARVALSPSGQGGLNGSSSVTSGGSPGTNAIAADTDHFALRLELHEQLTRTGLLILPGPDPLEMLDPPKPAV